MRKAFIDTLVELAGKDERIFLLTGDLGFSVLEGFRDRFPRRFFNMGVAEQNMIGVAAGLALSGKIVFVYSIVPFVTMRCLEQIRNDLCFHNLDVRIVGIGAGLTYGPAGATHHAVEDVSIMRSLVNMTVLSPGDPAETRVCVREACHRKGPVYIRLGKGVDAPVHRQNVKFSIGKAIVLRKGTDLTLIASGSMLSMAERICKKLGDKGLCVRFISMPTIKPIDQGAISDAAKATRAVFTLEEHGEIGGLGSAVADVLAESKNKVLFRKFALKDVYRKTVGSRDYLLKKEGLSEEGITRSIFDYMRKV